MYSLLSGLYRYMFKKEEYFVLILGLDNAGKTTYLEQAKTKFDKNYKPMNLKKITSTVGLNIGKVDKGAIRLNFWDLGGQEELQSLWDKYYAESHAVVYLVDSADTERLHESKEAFDKVIDNETLDGVPFLIVFNKQDLPGCLTVAELKEIFNNRSRLRGNRDCKVIAASALKGDGVEEGIHWVIDCVQRNAHVRPPMDREISH